MIKEKNVTGVFFFALASILLISILASVATVTHSQEWPKNLAILCYEEGYTAYLSGYCSDRFVEASYLEWKKANHD